MSNEKMNNLQTIIDHENAQWSQIFKSELEKKDFQEFSSYWWRNYYQELTQYFDKILSDNDFKNVLEAGSGSGKATILLNQKLSKTLLDISDMALQYAQHIAGKFNCKNAHYVKGNIFEMPFEDGKFDFVWNIGVIEHYETDDIEKIMVEMMRVTREDGIIAVGMPNKISGPILKAWLLKVLKIFPGYKLDTEKFYKISEIQNLLYKTSSQLDREIEQMTVNYFGNPLIMETPKFILQTFGKIFDRFFKKNKFLIVVTCKFK